MARIYHRYETWEDYNNGMYKKICFMDQSGLVQQCKDLLACPQWLYESMVFVSLNWSNSAEHNLTNTNRNRQAWLGQSACCFTHGAPEYITKIAWNNLDPKQQNEANKVADSVIAPWEERFNRGVHREDLFTNECFRCC
jgi:hypothetical protein